MTEIWTWLMENYPQLLIVVSSLLATAEVIVKLTPTKSDDSALERIGSFWTKLISWIPGVKKS